MADHPPRDELNPSSDDCALWQHHEWVRWLTPADAQVLLLYLCQTIADPGVSLEGLRTLVEGWEDNALKAPAEDDWRARVDGYLEVWVDARLAMLARGRI
jgi:hypothetical protein